jgi:hypothetical protein
VVFQLGGGRGTNNPSLLKIILPSFSKCFGPGLILWNELGNRKSTWNIMSLCRVGAVKSVVGELENYKIQWEYKCLRGNGRDIKQQATIYFSVENGMLITN